jgi:hypothetical protein
MHARTQIYVRARARVSVEFGCSGSANTYADATRKRANTQHTNAQHANTQTCNTQTRKRATCKRANAQTRKRANAQTRKRANAQHAKRQKRVTTGRKPLDLGLQQVLKVFRLQVESSNRQPNPAVQRLLTSRVLATTALDPQGVAT